MTIIFLTLALHNNAYEVCLEGIIMSETTRVKSENTVDKIQNMIIINACHYHVFFMHE